jgi:hypothetical protein
MKYVKIFVVIVNQKSNQIQYCCLSDSSFLCMWLSDQAMSDADESNNPNLTVYDTCNAGVNFPPDCNSMVLNLANTELARSCTSVKLFWSYPVKTMTLIIETSSTQKRESYAISMDNRRLKPAISHVYRVLDNQETEITTSDDRLIQESDSNYQVILKFQGPSEMTYYGVSINYDVIQK